MAVAQPETAEKDATKLQVKTQEVKRPSVVKKPPEGSPAAAAAQEKAKPSPVKKSPEELAAQEAKEKAALEAAAAQSKDSALQVDFRTVLKNKPGSSEVSPKEVTTVTAEEPVAAAVKDETGATQLDFRATLKKKEPKEAKEEKPKEPEPEQPEFLYLFSLLTPLRNRFLCERIPHILSL